MSIARARLKPRRSVTVCQCFQASAASPKIAHSSVAQLFLLKRGLALKAPGDVWVYVVLPVQGIRSRPLSAGEEAKRCLALLDGFHGEPVIKGCKQAAAVAGESQKIGVCDLCRGQDTCRIYDVGPD